MIVVVDAGNTRVKWGVREAGAWVARGVLDHADLSGLEAALGPWARARALVACSVADAAVGAAVEAAAEAIGVRVHWVRAEAACAGVSNGYARPEQLGADRWAAALGAWGLLGQSCLVVSAGTATTVDFLVAEAGGARFAGGVILPGVDLMCAALATQTARLPRAKGRCVPWPDNTDDAIATGCLQAQAGAIERLHRQLPPGAPCLLAGGAAAAVMPLLDLPVRRVDDLVLLGLLRVAAAKGIAPGIEPGIAQA